MKPKNDSEIERRMEAMVTQVSMAEPADLLMKKADRFSKG